MSTTNGVGQNNSDIYTALGLNAPNSDTSKKKSTLDQADFMRLMTEQLRHQDPLKPMDNTQMVAQMAQLSQVQGITDLNNTVKGFQDSMSSDQILRGAPWWVTKCWCPRRSSRWKRTATSPAWWPRPAPAS